jgi:hypothetical protein
MREVETCLEQKRGDDTVAVIPGECVSEVQSFEPEQRGLIADVMLDCAGVYLAASTPNLAIRGLGLSGTMPRAD